MNDKKYILLGLGVEGKASLKFLLKKISKENIIVADGNEKARENAELKELLSGIPEKNLFFGENYLDALDYGDVVVKSPGVGILNTPKLAKYIEEKKVILSSNLDLFFDNIKGKVIAISGSKGKSTTTTLTYEIFKNAGFKTKLIGNIGLPGTDAIDDDDENSIYVNEMSSYQLENFHRQLDAGIFTSFFPEHLDYHQTMDNYKNAKLNLVKNIKGDGFLVYNKILEDIFDNFEKMPYKKERNITDKDFIKDNFIYINNEKFINTDELNLIGKHNFENAILAIKMAKHFGIADESIKNTLKNFTPLPHRLEKIAPINDIYFIDDAISTTPESTIAGINSVSMPIYSIILGGLDRGYDFSELLKVVTQKNIKKIAFLKDSGERIKTELENYCKENSLLMPKNKVFSSMDGVVNFCIEGAPKNSVCLLSCASPSYSIFKNYIEKGNLFKAEIEKLRK